MRRVILAIAVLAASACCPSCPFKLRIRPDKHISNFTLDRGFVYFGGGYHLYRIDLSTRGIEALYTTDSIKVEQPLVADGVAYFGGSSKRLTDEAGRAWGEDSGFIAFDLSSRRIQWKFPLGVKDWDTGGTYPVIAGDRVLVCARTHLHCLDRKTGIQRWKADNWFGGMSDGVTLPFVYKEHVYFKIFEEFFTKSRDLDGHWAELALTSGQRTAVLPIVRSPGDYHDENAVQALNKRTGDVIWSEPLGELARHNSDGSPEWPRDYEAEWSRRFAATDDIVVIQGSQGIGAREAPTGKPCGFSRRHQIEAMPIR